MYRACVACVLLTGLFLMGAIDCMRSPTRSQEHQLELQGNLQFRMPLPDHIKEALGLHPRTKPTGHTVNIYVVIERPSEEKSTIRRVFLSVDLEQGYAYGATTEKPGDIWIQAVYEDDGTIKYQSERKLITVVDGVVHAIVLVMQRLPNGQLSFDIVWDAEAPSDSVVVVLPDSSRFLKIQPLKSKVPFLPKPGDVVPLVALDLTSLGGETTITEMEFDSPVSFFSGGLEGAVDELYVRLDGEPTQTISNPTNHFTLLMNDALGQPVRISNGQTRTFTINGRISPTFIGFRAFSLDVVAIQHDADRILGYLPIYGYFYLIGAGGGGVGLPSPENPSPTSAEQ